MIMNLVLHDQNNELNYHSLIHAAYAHLMVQLLFEPQQNQEDNHFIFSFSQVYITVTSMIEYGSNCQALDNQATLLGFNVTNNVTTLTFPISGITDNICFIVTINNTFQSIAIQGNFTFETKGKVSHIVNTFNDIIMYKYAFPCRCKSRVKWHFQCRRFCTNNCYRGHDYHNCVCMVHPKKASTN